MWCNRRSSWTSIGGVGLKIQLRLPVLLRIRPHPKTSGSANSVIQFTPTKAAGDIFSDSDRFFSLSPDPKMLNLDPGSFPESFQIWEFNFCSDWFISRKFSNLRIHLLFRLQWPSIQPKFTYVLHMKWSLRLILLWKSTFFNVNQRNGKLKTFSATCRGHNRWTEVRDVLLSFRLNNTSLFACISCKNTWNT